MRRFFTLLIWFGLFFPLALSAMIMSSMRPWILDRAFYEGVVNDDRVYDVLLNGELANQFNQQIFAADQLPVAALNSALGQLMTPNDLRTQSAYVVNELVDFIQGRASKFDISIDLASVKTALSGAAGQRFAATLAASLPFCQSDQTSIAPAGTLPRCISSHMSIAATAAQIAHALPAALTNAPDRLLLSNTLDLQTDLSSLDWFLGVTVRSGLDMAIVMVILLTVLVGILLSYLRGSDLYGSLRWLSKSLFVPASIFLLVGIILANPLVANALQSTAIQASDAFSQALANMTVLIVQRAGSGLLVTGALTGVIALVLFMFSWRTDTNERSAVKMVQVQIN
ncbi:MAG: hypothetical protein ABI970_03785 [Chloroflexota bacterium]